jgi:hypothetical protein
MIILEGPDGGGKSTLAKQLAVLWDLPIAERVVSKDTEAMIDLKAWTEENVRNMGPLQVYDRHRLISEPIYGPILRAGRPQPGFESLGWLSAMTQEFYRHQPIIIYCIPPLEVVMENLRDDPDNEVVRDQIQSIYALYTTRAAMDVALRPTMTAIWDYTTDGREDHPLATFRRWTAQINHIKDIDRLRDQVRKASK